MFQKYSKYQAAGAVPSYCQMFGRPSDLLYWSQDIRTAKVNLVTSRLYRFLYWTTLQLVQKLTGVDKRHRDNDMINIRSIFRYTMKNVKSRGSRVGLMCIIQIAAAISALLCYRAMYLPLDKFLTMSWRVLRFRKEEKASWYRGYLRMYWISRHVSAV